MPLNPEQFAHFLYGFSETSQTPPTPAQWAVIQEKLNGVFNKVTPNRHVPEPSSVPRLSGDIAVCAPSRSGPIRPYGTGDFTAVYAPNVSITC